MQFIKLTERQTGDVTRTIILNTSQIANIQLGNKKDTYIKLLTGDKFFVVESIDEIWTMLSGIPVQAAPERTVLERFNSPYTRVL